MAAGEAGGSDLRLQHGIYLRLSVTIVSLQAAAPFLGNLFRRPNFSCTEPCETGGCSSGQLKQGSAGKCHSSVKAHLSDTPEFFWWLSPRSVRRNMGLPRGKDGLKNKIKAAGRGGEGCRALRADLWDSPGGKMVLENKKKRIREVQGGG